jgi:hypothetical protein
MYETTFNSKFSGFVTGVNSKEAMLDESSWQCTVRFSQTDSDCRRFNGIQAFWRDNGC